MYSKYNVIQLKKKKEKKIDFKAILCNKNKNKTAS